MERLTKRLPDGKVVTDCDSGCILSGFVIREDKVKIWDRRADHLALEAETTQIIDGCCTACGALMACCEAAEYEFCPMCGRKFWRDK